MASRFLEIKKRYGSVREIILHYARLRCSRSMTARYLGVERATLRRWIKHFNLDGEFASRRRMLPECQRGTLPGQRGGGAAQRYSLDEIWSAIRTCQTSTEAARMGITRTMIRRRLGLSWSEAKQKCMEAQRA